LGVAITAPGGYDERVNGGGIVRRWAAADGRRKWATPLV
jgi:hypothetical protein